MKLLLDENLSRRLVPFLQEAFPGTSQVALLGLQSSRDMDLWEFARRHDFVIVSSDADFHELSLLRGAPPHVVWVKTGNLSKAAMLSLLTRHVAAIHDAIEVDHLACVELVRASA